LLPAVATQRMKNIAGKALRVNPHQWRSGMNIPHHKRHSFLNRATSGAGFRSETVDSELAPARREVCRCEGLKRVRSHFSIIATIIAAAR